MRAKRSDRAGTERDTCDALKGIAAGQSPYRGRSGTPHGGPQPAHNPEVAGSNPAPATTSLTWVLRTQVRLLFGALTEPPRASGFGSGVDNRVVHSSSSARFPTAPTAPRSARRT